MRNNILMSTEGCFACPIRCKRVVRAREPYATDPDYGGPEYETIAALGSLCGISDLNAIAYGNQLCNAYGLDTISTGVVIAFAMECYERGIITKEDTGGLEIRFGDEKVMIKLIEMIAKREGFGDILAEGVKRAAERIGRGAEKFAMHVKGKEIPMHEPRGKASLALAYALSPNGADHVQAPHDPLFERISEFVKPLGILRPVNRLSLGPDKVRLFIYLSLWWGLFDCLGFCKFTVVPQPAGVLQVHHIVDLVKAATGWNTSLWELMKASERVINLTRAFNIREGFTSKDDSLPDRFFQPLMFGARKGSKIHKKEFKEALRLFYEMMGWDPETGIPKKAKLRELGLDEVVSELY